MMTVGVFIMKASNHMISPIKDKVNTLEIRLAYKKLVGAKVYSLEIRLAHQEFGWR